MSTPAKLTHRPFEVLIPNAEGDGIAERITIEIPVVWDEDLEEFLLTPEAHELIEATKARHLGLLSPNEIKDLRLRLNLTQRQMSELIQAGEKSYTRWESGQARPSRVINLLLRAIADGKIPVQWLKSQNLPEFTWSRVRSAHFIHYREQTKVVMFTASSTNSQPPDPAECTDEAVSIAA